MQRNAEAGARETSNVFIYLFIYFGIINVQLHEQHDGY